MWFKRCLSHWSSTVFSFLGLLVKKYLSPFSSVSCGTVFGRWFCTLLIMSNWNLLVRYSDMCILWSWQNYISSWIQLSSLLFWYCCAERYVEWCNNAFTPLCNHIRVFDHIYVGITFLSKPFVKCPIIQDKMQTMFSPLYTVTLAMLSSLFPAVSKKSEGT